MSELLMKKFKNKYSHNRRAFISNLIKTGIVFNFGSFIACVDSEYVKLTDRQNSILEFTLNYIWPNDGNGPGIESANVMHFFLWVLSDKNFDPEIKQYLYNGMTWVDETATENYYRHFEKLKRNEKEELFAKITETDWGDGWISKIINFIFEALFSDPIYGSNPDNISYKWLQHNPGFPRPEDKNKYESLLLKKNKNEIISDINELNN